MLSFKHFLSEVWHSSLVSTYGDKKSYDVHKNPSASETAKLIHNSEHKSLRGILHGKDAYVWDAGKSLHYEVDDAHFKHVPRKEKTYINIGRDRVSLSDAYDNRPSEDHDRRADQHPWVNKALPNHRKMFNYHKPENE